MDIELRKTEPDDIPPVIGLMREFAAYEDLLRYFEATEERLREAMFGRSAFVEGLVAVHDRKIIGYAIYFPTYATFRGQRGFYLEDIYVSAEHRGAGAGEQMIRQIARLARERGFERIDFLVLDWNRSAIGFYEKLGAVRDDEERHFKFTDGAFQRLAGQA